MTDADTWRIDDKDASDDPARAMAAAMCADTGTPCTISMPCEGLAVCTPIADTQDVNDSVRQPREAGEQPYPDTAQLPVTPPAESTTCASADDAPTMQIPAQSSVKNRVRDLVRQRAEHAMRRQPSRRAAAASGASDYTTRTHRGDRL